MIARKFSSPTLGIVASFLLATLASPAFGAQPEIVHFRLGEWRSQHFNDEAKATEFHAAVVKLGCEAKTGSHGDHVDVTYRCPKWRSLQAESHDSAHGWENWLKQAGFETKHTH